MEYDIEGDWRLLPTCNFRCDYCFFSPAELGEKLRTSASPEDWQAAFDGTGLTWLLHITGGEPSVYPRFVDLTRRLTRKHVISLNTNLSHASLLDFAHEIDPLRVSFINAGFHPGERRSRNGDDAFARHARALNAARFPLFATVVATPEALAAFDDAVERLAPAGLYPVPKLLRTFYKGHHYPYAYSAEDRARFRRYSERARAFYDPMLSALASPPTVAVFDDGDLLKALPSFEGQSCRAGRDFVSITPEGDVYDCSMTTRSGQAKTPLGNLLAGDFRRRPGPEICDSQYCYYFCQKYSTPRPAYHPRSIAKAVIPGPMIDRLMNLRKAGARRLRPVAGD